MNSLQWIEINYSFTVEEYQNWTFHFNPYNLLFIGIVAALHCIVENVHDITLWITDKQNFSARFTHQQTSIFGPSPPLSWKAESVPEYTLFFMQYTYMYSGGSFQDLTLGIWPAKARLYYLVADML